MWLSLFFFISVNENGDKLFGFLYSISKFWKGQHLNQIGWIDGNLKEKKKSKGLVFLSASVNSGFGCSACYFSSVTSFYFKYH